VNETLARMFGYAQAELCGKLGPLDLTCRDSQAKAQREIDRRISGEAKASFYAFRGVRKNGSEFDTEVFGVATSFRGKPAIIGILNDISLRRAAERELADQLNFVGKLIDTIPNPVFYKDAEARYLGCNKAFEDFLGMKRTELVGKSVFDIAPTDLAERYHAADQALFDRPGTQSYEAAVQSADGRRREVIFNKATFSRADGSLGGLVGVVLDISDRKRMEERVWREANYDSLTALPNRRLCSDRLQEAFKHARRSGEKLALMFIDLDRFKEVNDTLGHRVGDLLLIEAARRILGCVRESDTVARQGGDEFIVLLPDVADAAAAGRVAQHIIDVLAEPFDLAGEMAYVSGSAGIALFPDDAESIDTLQSYADQAMYSAKAKGRNGYCFFVGAFQEDARARLALANELREAVALGQLALDYQPIVDLASGEIVKAEALVRWHHPRLGQVPPDRFIPVAEEIGLIGALGDWVFREACRAALAWNRARPPGLPPIPVSVNKSPRQFILGNTHETWLDFLDANGIPVDHVVLEITEGMLLDARPEVVVKLDTFRRAGIGISLDDFGTGYSAMAYLKKFAIDHLKIDRSFVRDMVSDPNDHAIIEAIIVMAHKLGIRVIAEGVETAEQSAQLSEAGCDFAQGYHFARPMPAAEFEALLARRSPAVDGL
jgi:diguanylate cyclase (GGDEF)-like protein/PAS domain S-box-containing protein